MYSHDACAQGQAATYFDGGRTVHYKLKVPIKLNSTSKCSFKETSATAEMIRKASLLVIDEYTLGNKLVYETVDRSLRELLKNDKPFGGKVILFSGDWKQILPVVPNGQRTEIVKAAFKSSYLWDSVKLLHLTQNMRANEDEEFAKYLLDVGNGNVKIHTEVGPDMIKIPDQNISKSENVKEFCQEIYPNLGKRITEGFTERADNADWNKFVHERSIICPTNAEAEEVNRICLDMMEGEPTIYRSADFCIHKKDQVAYPTEFLNKITPSGTPSHVLVLKKGAPITLLRNLDPLNGHVNGSQ